jgi:hypothetical protein
MYMISDHSGQKIAIVTTIWWWQEFGETSMNIQRLHEFCMERFNLKKLNDIEGKKQYHVEVS